MLHVWALSGAPVAELHVEELKARLQETEDLLVVALKRYLGAQLGCSRFRLKLLGEESQVIDNDAPLTGPADFTLVRMDFQSSDSATNAAFVSACEGGRATEVEFLLRAPQNPDSRDDRRDCTGIHAAAGNGHLVVVRLLLEAGADKDSAKRNGTTALHLASGHLVARNDHLAIVQLLLEARADKDAADKGGWTSLHMAVQCGHSDVVRLLLEAGADKDAAKEDGWTAMHLAAQDGNLAIVRLLLEARADKDAATQRGATALQLASRRGHLDVQQLLLETGTEENAAIQSGCCCT